MATIRLNNELRKRLKNKFSQHYSVVNPAPCVDQNTIPFIRTAINRMPAQNWLKETHASASYQSYRNNIRFISRNSQVRTYNESKIKAFHMSPFTSENYMKLIKKDFEKILFLVKHPDSKMHSQIAIIEIDFGTIEPLNLVFPNEMACPNNNYDAREIALQLEEFLEKDKELLESILMPCVKKQIEVSEKKQHVTEKFEVLLATCTTVNQVIKAYPEAIHLLEREERTTLETKIKRPANNRIPIDFDLGETNLILEAKAIALINNESI